MNNPFLRSENPRGYIFVEKAFQDGIPLTNVYFNTNKFRSIYLSSAGIATFRVDDDHISVPGVGLNTLLEAVAVASFGL